MNIKTSLATLTGKTIKKIINIRGKSRGETAPGLALLNIDPDYIAHTNKNIAHKILITGTNGKTTTTRMITHILNQNKIKFVNNHSGSNLVRGVATASLNIQKDTTHAIWETDEAAFVTIAQQVKPTHILITNLFRDQLDRYGEIDTLSNKWLTIIKKLPKLTLILNADDPSLVYLGSKLPQHTIVYYGISTEAVSRPSSSTNDPSQKKTTPSAHADAIFCPNCGKILNYTSITFSHLGNYSCNCNFQHPKPYFIGKNIQNFTNKTQISILNTQYSIPLTGLYNAYNAVAAITLSQLLNIDPKDSLTTFKPAFGRQESIKYKNKSNHLYLVKNPTGFNTTIDTLHQIQQSSNKQIDILIAINDRLADGTDVSWLWDVNFDKLVNIVNSIIITGDRRLDMAVRMKYTDFDMTKIQIIKDRKNAINQLNKSKQDNLYILPTYTALWELRKILLAK